MEQYSDNLTIWIITLSDRASRGIYRDACGPYINEQISAHFEKLGITIVKQLYLIEDDPAALHELLEQASSEKVDVVFTTGGTGLGPRDFTPDVVSKLADKQIPGIMEGIRVKYGQENPLAWLSRSIAVMIGSTLVFTLPGSIRAVKEYVCEILPLLKHMTDVIQGIDPHIPRHTLQNCE